MRTIEETKAKLTRQLNICDTTIREAENCPGVVLSDYEKRKLARLLDSAKVPQIDVGMPGSGPDEKADIKSITKLKLNSSIMTFNRVLNTDIDESLACDVDSVAIAASISGRQIAARYKIDPGEILKAMANVVSYAKEHGLYVSCIFEDSSHASLSDFVKWTNKVQEYGADRVCYSDSVGVEDPLKLAKKIEVIKQVTDIDLEIQSRNDFGMATANTVAGIGAGAVFASTSVLGIGPRAGNAPTEEIIMAAEEKFGLDTGIDIKKIKEVATTVSKNSSKPIWESKPVFGSNCFALETIADNSQLEVFEPYNPALIGSDRRVILGRHSSVESIIFTLEKVLNERLPANEKALDMAQKLTEMVKVAAVKQHRNITPDELKDLYDQLLDEAEMEKLSEEEETE